MIVGTGLVVMALGIVCVYAACKILDKSREDGVMGIIVGTFAFTSALCLILSQVPAP